MTATVESAPVSAPQPVGHLANEAQGINFWRHDRAFRDLMTRYLAPEVLTHLQPYFDRLGALAGGRLDELARLADRNPPILHPRDKFGRDEDWIEYHLSYREMETVAYQEFGMHAVTHRAGVLDWPDRLPPSVKFALQYLFGQAEFGLLCPVSGSDTSAYIIGRFGSTALQRYLLPRMLSQDPAALWKGAQFMTEKAGGSDVGAIETTAEPVGRNALGLEEWKLFGDKWFCSHTDARW
ncbi:hypothetical protein C1Y40_05415 [Mycobacterium talmoniae]|uniref:Adaptive response protein AidB N-terminal domain-containing protein n=1 Tax=Mycobacterium talmoniae TaxID=1858794 RepID=A0A2S8BCQ7_9MYCO|nr:hypothetical protein C1Y40_05415 [Mycobacterium talmoniae]